MPRDDGLFARPKLSLMGEFPKPFSNKPKKILPNKPKKRQSTKMGLIQGKLETCPQTDLKGAQIMAIGKFNF